MHCWSCWQCLPPCWLVLEVREPYGETLLPKITWRSDATRDITSAIQKPNHCAHRNKQTRSLNPARSPCDCEPYHIFFILFSFAFTPGFSYTLSEAENNVLKKNGTKLCNVSLAGLESLPKYISWTIYSTCGLGRYLRVQLFQCQPLHRQPIYRKTKSSEWPGLDRSASLSVIRVISKDKILTEKLTLPDSHVRVSGEDLQRINKTSIPLPSEENAYWATLGVTHELHCLVCPSLEYPAVDFCWLRDRNAFDNISTKITTSLIRQKNRRFWMQFIRVGKST